MASPSQPHFFAAELLPHQEISESSSRIWARSSSRDCWSFRNFSRRRQFSAASWPSRSDRRPASAVERRKLCPQRRSVRLEQVAALKFPVHVQRRRRIHQRPRDRDEQKRFWPHNKVGQSLLWSLDCATTEMRLQQTHYEATGIPPLTSGSNCNSKATDRHPLNLPERASSCARLFMYSKVSLITHPIFRLAGLLCLMRLSRELTYGLSRMRPTTCFVTFC